MTDERKTVRVSHHFHASAERVFNAWLDPAQAARFLFATATGQVIRCDIDARVGGAFTIVDRRPEGDIEHVGTYEAIERPSRLVFTFGVPAYSQEMTRVAIEITPGADGGCDLTLVHEGVLPEYAVQTAKGWTGILEVLETAL